GDRQIATLQPFPLAEEHARGAGDTELETGGDPLGALEEDRGPLGGADLPRRRLEEGEPAVEMAPVDRQGEVHAHRLALIAARAERDRGPEGTHALEVPVPVLDPRLEHRSEPGVRAHAGVEGVNEAFD